MPLTEKQNTIVHYEDFTDKNKILCLASAGSGKSFTVTERLIHMINDLNVDTNDVAMFSFSRTATRELREKVKENVSKTAFERLTISTFHAYCYKIVRDNYVKLDLDNSSLNIVSDDQVYGLVRKFLKDYNHYHATNPVNLDFFYDNFKLYRKDKPHELSPHEILEADSIITYMKNHSMYTFADLLDMVHKLFEKNKQIREVYQKEFKYIIIDESQDTLSIVWDILDLMLTEETHLMVVGDILQTLYMFAGADPFKLIDFLNKWNAETFKLDETFRFGEEVSKVADLVVRQIPIDDKYKMFTKTNQISEKTEFRFLEIEKEHEDIVSSIIDLMEKGVEPIDISILGRTNKYLMNISKILTMNGIKNVMRFGSIMKRKEILILLNTIQILNNVNDINLGIVFKELDNNIDSKIIINILRDFEGKTIFQLEDHVNNNKIKLMGNRRLEAFKDFCDTMQDIENIVKNKESKTTFRDIALALNIDDFIFMRNKHSEDGRDNRAERWEFITMLDDIKNGNNLDISQIENHLKLNFASDDENEKTNAVYLRTIHASKGMTLPYTFLSLSSGFWNPFFISDEPAQKKKDVFAEFCCLYVGITRAKNKLIVYNSDPSHPFSFISGDTNIEVPEDKTIAEVGIDPEIILNQLKSEVFGKGCTNPIPTPRKIVARTDKALLIEVPVGKTIVTVWIPKMSCSVKNSNFYANDWYKKNHPELFIV